MIWSISFAASAAILAAALLYAWDSAKQYKSGRILTPFHWVFTGVFAAVFVGMIPVLVPALEAEPGFMIKLFVFDMIQTIQAFTINLGADYILENIVSAETTVSGVYSVYMTGLFLAAPLLTFGFLVSLFKDLLADLAFLFRYKEDVYVFSELNEKSLALAASIRQTHKKALLVFTNVDRDEGNIQTEYLEAAKEQKAILFRKDIVTVDFMKHSPKAKLVFLEIGKKEGETLIQSMKLLERYRFRKNTDLYVFSSDAEGELLLSNAPKDEVRVRRVNEVRSLVYQFLYEEGERIFTSARPCADGRKEINAYIVGLGKYGTELLKALTWYSQMDGYVVNIHAFDQNELAEEIFAARCPELMSEKYNGVQIPGESAYTIRIHSGVDVRTKTFAECISLQSKPTIVFVCLGDDAVNINQAVNIRMLCERAGCTPVIKAIVHSIDELKALSGVRNYRGQPYGIEAIGDFQSTYSEETLIGSELERLALERHLKWGREEEFWRYEYNYRSSMASAIHRKARIACGIPGAEKRNEDLLPEERDIIEVLEHKRWNAYMRSEGYVYSGSRDPASRNDLAKMHHDLVDFDSLTEEEKRRNSVVGTI